MNFVPTRPVDEIAREYVEGFWQLYDPIAYLDRVFRHYLLLKDANFPRKPKSARKKLDPANRRALIKLCFRQGVMRKSRFKFWTNLYRMFRVNRGGIGSYLSTCAQGEHFLDYRKRVRAEIEAQMGRPAPTPLPPSAAATDSCGTTAAPLVQLHLKRQGEPVLN
jgi:hypothetical protein